MKNIESKIRRAGIIIAAGLILQFLSLLPLHPLAFIAFVGIGVPLMALGVLLFLLALVSQDGHPEHPIEQSELAGSSRTP